MIDWRKSYSVIWRVFKVNEQTWADSELIGGIDSIQITRSCSGDAPMLESGTMTLTGGFERGYYRIVAHATQDVETERVDVATLLCESTKATRNYGTVQPSVNCNSVLYPAYTQRILDGEYIAKGADVAQYVAELLRGCIKAPVEVEGGFAITEFYWFDFGIRILEAAWQALDLGGYVMQVDGRGVVHIRKKPTAPALDLDGANITLLQPSVVNEFNTSNVPNRYIAKSDDVIAIAVNDSPDSDVSTVNRGYVYDQIDDAPAPVDSETLPEYAVRRLHEMSTSTAETRNYTREYWPDVYPFDVVAGTLDSIGIDGNMRVVNQTLKCANGITVREQVAREVDLWQ